MQMTVEQTALSVGKASSVTGIRGRQPIISIKLIKCGGPRFFRCYGAECLLLDTAAGHTAAGHTAAGHTAAGHTAAGHTAPQVRFNTRYLIDWSTYLYKRVLLKCTHK